MCSWPASIPGIRSRKYPESRQSTDRLLMGKKAKAPQEADVSTSKRSAFTLVELLVVIGIIALLIAMLFPALTRARQQAQWVQCQSNLRQIGIHLEMYANDWKGWIFPPRLGAS